MQRTDQTASTGPESSSAPGSSARSRGVRLLVAALLSLLSAFIASLIAVMVMGILRLVVGVPSPVELFGDVLLKHMTAGQFVQLLLQFSPNSKLSPLGLALLGMIGAGTALGLVYAVATRVQPPVAGNRPSRREWLTAAVLALLMVLAGVIIFWSELGQSFVGLPYAWARVVNIVSLLVEFGLYGLVLCVSYRALLPKQPLAASANGASAPRGRRQLLARAGVAVLSVAGAGGTLGAVKTYLNNYSGYDGMVTVIQNGHTAPITPNSDHYVVTQNAIDPTVDLNLWRLEIGGLVGSSGSYTYDELTSLPSTTRAVTLECIANNISTGGRLISTAIWQGVTLRTLLARHGGALPSAAYAAFYSVDGYSVSLPLKEELADDAFVAWRMNGSELPTRHGFPLRVLIPGHYGEENPKWVTRIELTDQFVGGLYADQGWYNGQLHTMVRIDRPRGQLKLGQSVEIGGLAFAGPRGIEKVEVSTDNGITWNTATLQAAMSQDSWVFWTWNWTPTQPGSFTLAARATDGTGAVQTATTQGSVPNGSTGYHKVKVQVA